ncbi:unnamed protein product [Mytilus coruscus]|uniref:TRIM2_3 n=1 Tax=Mytilus coruscus TaxID=42192 RepID=A0A6J8C1M8_MYTCO|nr:unnamed protein product [Mytilus coruscus]
MLPTTHVPTIDDLKITLIKTVNTIGRDITGCSLLPDGRMIFSCFKYGQIHVVKPDGSLDFTVQLGSHTSHIYFIEDSQTLVLTSVSEYSCIKIINMNTRKMEKSITVESRIYGIAHKDGKLFCNGYSSGLCVVSLDDDSITQLVKVSLSLYSSIASWSDQLYYINEDDSVTCCDLQGTIKWKLELAAFLKNARGITVDNYGRVYVAGFDSKNVVVILPDGNKHRVLLSKKDGLTRPQALFFDRNNNQLLIWNQVNEAFLYDVSK